MVRVIVGIWHQMTRWLIGKDLEASGHGLIAVLPGICPEGLKNIMKNLRIPGALAKIQTDHLNASLEHYY
jgi:hypothetical protein